MQRVQREVKQSLGRAVFVIQVLHEITALSGMEAEVADLMTGMDPVMQEEIVRGMAIGQLDDPAVEAGGKAHDFVVNLGFQW